VVALYLWPWEWFLDLKEEKEGDDAAQEGESHGTGQSLETASRLSRYRWSGLNGDIFTIMFLTVALSSLRKCLLLAALACILRPTNILVWMCLAGFAVYHTPRSTNLIIVREAIACG
jgi:phosphatidylinositol glycan class B